MIHYLKSTGDTVVSVAFTGIAASLLIDGQTVHSKFGVLIFVDRYTTWDHTGEKYDEIKCCKLILWDEVSMCSKYIIEACDRMLRDLCQINEPFGGKVVIFAGDFRQTLPITLGGDLARSVAVCFKTSYLWPLVSKHKLTRNMRANEDQEYCDWLMSIGNKTHAIHDQYHRDYIEIKHNEIVLPRKPELLHQFAFNTTNELIEPEKITNNMNAAILTPLNRDVEALNLICLEHMSGESKTYFSADEMALLDNNQESNLDYELVQTEVLNKQNPSGYPPHVLILKVGAIIMLLKNIAVHIGLCNGTRLKIQGLYEKYIDGEVLYGRNKGQSYILHRHLFRADRLHPPPMAFDRTQIPVKLAFSMTINKSQGQTLDRIAIYLPEPVFAHGQLYVAFSRVRTFASVRILVERRTSARNKQGVLFAQEGNLNTWTKNVVCIEVLGDE